MDNAATDLLATGVPGLDDILGGGLRRGACALLEGVPGAGKTTLGTQFIHHGITACDEPGLIFSFEEFPHEIFRDARAFGWDLDALERQDKLRVVGTSPDVFSRETMQPGGLFDQLMEEILPRRVLVDSISLMAHVTRDPQELRELVYGLRNCFRRLGLTAMMTKEVASADPEVIPFEEYVADAVIRLSYRLIPESGDRLREVEVTKSRTQAHVSGRHLLEIGPNGLTVYPAPRAGVLGAPAPHAPLGTEPVTSGCRGLDHMLRGGLLPGSLTIVAGSTGVGKTVLGLQFLHAGARQGQRGLLISLEQTADDLRRATASLGLPLEHLQPGGAISVFQGGSMQEPVGMTIARIARAVKEVRPQRLVLDAISTLDRRPGDRLQVRADLVALLDMLRASGATCLVCDETPGIIGGFAVTGGALVSAMADNIVAMRYVELASAMRRALSVLKARCVDHDKEIREYVIGQGGVELKDKFRVATGLLTGAPVRADVDGYF
ncbi:MAG: AAA family ATPase [Armatimonadetes bacterium]|nr:AAA family ATPase [Armatimonadota bacterium]